MNEQQLTIDFEQKRAARAARDSGITRAAEHADRQTPEWTDLAYDAFLAVARQHETFTTEQARNLSRHIPDPPDKRAWGQVARRAVRDGVIVKDGFTVASDPKVHCNVVTQWRSRIARPS